MTRSYHYLIITGLLLLLGVGAPVSALDDYDYYQMIEYTACDQETYQQDIVIHRTTGTAYQEADGPLRIWHIYVGDYCREDYGDVRFTNSTGELAYYLWPDYDCSSARFTVRLEGATTAGTLTVWYGNQSATTTSDGEEVFVFFDDMRKDRSSLYTPSEGWNYDAVNHYIRATSMAKIWIANLTVSDFIMTVDMKSDVSYDVWSLGLMFRASNESSGYYYNNDPVIASNYRLGRLPSAILAESDSIPPPGAFHTVRITALGPQISAQAEGFPLLSATDTTHASGGVILVADVLRDDYKYFRNIIVRAHSATPPAAITFSGKPIAGFHTTPAHTLKVICTDLSLGNPTSWHWDFGDGTSSTEQNPTHTYASPGTYTITLTVTNAYGTASSSQTLHVAPPSSVSFTYTVDGPELSTGTPIWFQGLISSDATSWRWYFGDGATSEERNPTHTYSKTGTYRVTLTATNEYGSISFSQNLHVFTGTIADPTPPPTHGAAFRWDPETGYYTSYWFNREGSFIDVHGLFFALMLPLTQIFGSWVFLIIWGTLCMGLYLYTQDTTMPFIVGILGGSMMAFLMGEDALVVMLLTMAFAGGGILAKVLLGRV